MPVYLVRHPEDKMSVVCAKDLLELYAATDCGEYVSRRPVTIEEYDKPLCLTFSTESPLMFDRYKDLAMFPDPDTTAECLTDNGNLLTSGLYSDITLLVDDEEFHCHKAILANRCEYFKVMFEMGMKESQSDRISLKAHSVDTTRQILHYIYTGRIKIPMLDIEGQEVTLGTDAMDAKEMGQFFDELWKAADFYRLGSLEKLIQRKIAEFCLKKNVYLREEFLSYMFELASEHNCEDLKNFVAGALSQYLKETTGTTAYDIVEGLQSAELAQLVTYLYNEDRNLQEARDEDIVNGILMMSRDSITEMKVALESAIESGELSRDSCALHAVVKTFISSLTYSADKEKWKQQWGQIFEVFMDAKFPINKRNSAGDTALHLACRSDPDKIMIDSELMLMLLNWLLDYNANPFAKNRKGSTPLDEAHDHVNMCLPLMASYYSNSDDGLQLFTHSSLVQDIALKMVCLGRQKGLLRDAMERWGRNSMPRLPLPHEVHSGNVPYECPKTSILDPFDELSKLYANDQASDSEDQAEIPAFKAPCRYILNKSFLENDVTHTDKFTKSPSDFHVGTPFEISRFIGEGVLEENNALLRFMYPRFYKYLHHLLFVGHEETSYLEDPDILRDLERDAMRDYVDAAEVRGTGEKLQSVLTMMQDHKFHSALTEAMLTSNSIKDDLLSKLACLH